MRFQLELLLRMLRAPRSDRRLHICAYFRRIVGEFRQALYKSESVPVLEKIYASRNGTWLSFKRASLRNCSTEYILGVEPANS